MQQLILFRLTNEAGRVFQLLLVITQAHFIAQMLSRSFFATRMTDIEILISMGFLTMERWERRVFYIHYGFKINPCSMPRVIVVGFVTAARVRKRKPHYLAGFIDNFLMLISNYMSYKPENYWQEEVLVYPVMMLWDQLSHTVDTMNPCFLSCLVYLSSLYILFSSDINISVFVRKRFLSPHFFGKGDRIDLLQSLLILCIWYDGMLQGRGTSRPSCY